MTMRTSLPLIACLTLGCLGLLLHFIALTTSHWSVLAGKGRRGLWETCLGTDCIDFIEAMPLGDLFRTTRAFAVLAFLAGSASVVMTVIYMFAKDHKIVILIALGAAAITEVCIIVTVATYATGNIRKDYGILVLGVSWSFGLCATAMPLFLAHGALLFIHLIRINTNSNPAVATPPQGSAN